jgi:tRNA nucleotidyltransferase (CCA-adding enzyme)
VYEELKKTLEGADAANALRLARDVGLLPHLLPELSESIGFAQRSKYHDMSVDEHSLLVLERACALQASEAVRLAALLHDNAKPATAWGYLLDDDGQQYAAPAAEYERAPAERKLAGDENLHFYGRPPQTDANGVVVVAERTRTAMNRFAAANGGNREITEKVVLLVREHMYADDDDFLTLAPSARARRARRFIHRVGRDNVEELILLRGCDRAGKRVAAPEAGWDAEIQAFEAEVRAQMQAPMSTKELTINGNDLMEIGLIGPAIGVVQRALLERVVENPDENTRERLLEWARELRASSV